MQTINKISSPYIDANLKLGLSTTKYNVSKSVANSKERETVNIIDPVSKRVIVTIKNPKVPIKPPDIAY